MTFHNGLKLEVQAGLWGFHMKDYTTYKHCAIAYNED